MQAFVNGPIRAFDPLARTYRLADALVVDGGRIVALDAAAIGAGVPVRDLDGRCILPAFADAHVHLTDTGYFSGPHDLSGVRSRAAFADAVARIPVAPMILAGAFDDADWPEGPARADALDSVFGDRRALVARVDFHSCLVNRATLAWLDLDPALEGIERDAAGELTGRLTRAANWEAQTRFLAALPESQRRAAERDAAALALRAGAVHLHAQLVGLGSREAYATEIEALRRLPGVRVYPKICERDPELARAFGLPFVGGDVFLDGSIGSGTAAMSHGYCDRPGSGHLTLDDDAVVAYFAAAERAGIAAGVHAIGDRAIEQALRAWEQVLDGRASTHRHFIEHFECASRQQIARAARLGLYLSMQPQFDATWGGPQGMYADRLGAERARGMNDLAAALRAGAVVVGGDDAPVCPLAPLLGMDAAVHHHDDEARVTPEQALTMYTYDAARFGFVEERCGALHPGFDADFVIVDRDPLVDGTFAQTQVLETWSRGKQVF